MIGKDKRELANMKQSESYKTPKGIEIKKLYKEKSQKKKELIERLRHSVGKSMMQYEAIWCNNLFSRSIFNFLLVRPWENHLDKFSILII